MNEIQKIADNADLIVNGYAFTKCDRGYRVLNIKNPLKASVVSPDGATLETTMDDIEVGIVFDYFLKNKQFMED